MYRVNSDIGNPEILKRQQPLLRKIGLAMGAVVGLMYSIFAIDGVVNLDVTLLTAFTGSLFFAQQFFIFGIFMCSKKMRRVYGECLSKD